MSSLPQLDSHCWDSLHRLAGAERPSAKDDVAIAELDLRPLVSAIPLGEFAPPVLDAIATPDQISETDIATTGEFVIAWQGEGAGDANGVFFRRFNSDGSAKGGEQQIDGPFSTNSGLSVAIDSTGDFTFAYHEESALTGVLRIGFHEAPQVDLSNALTSIGEAAETTSSIKVADITIVDDGVGSNQLSLTGNDAENVEVVGRNELHLRADTELDHQEQAGFDATLAVDDTAVGTTIDDTDYEGDSFTVVGLAATSSGTLSVSPDGTFTDTENDASLGKLVDASNIAFTSDVAE